MSEDEERRPVIVKKVRPYPIEAVVEINGVRKPINIQKIEEVGFIASLGETVVLVGMEVKAHFILPVSNVEIDAPTKIMKTMDKFLDKTVEMGAKAGVDRLAEFRFLKINEEQRLAIHKFVRAIRNKKK